ncbi:MAG: SCP2 sterol-binding domain-containing protein [Myxococcota bacterium]|nr:SCP2 sterol-binding domain-containing protein [Myxococcota bacterium]
MPSPDLADRRPPVEEACDRLRKLFDADAAADVRVVYVIELAGAGGGELTARVDLGRLEVAPGAAQEVDLHLRFTIEDFFAVLSGQANVDMLFMEERIGWSGDLSLALKMRRLFRGQPEERAAR